MPGRLVLFVDADACPVKDEAFRVAARYRLKTFVVANAPLMVPRDPSIERVLVPQGPDVADDWIAARAGPGAIVVTADVPLAARCLAAGADALAPNGRAFTPDSIGMGARHPQPHERPARRGRAHARPQTVRAARPLGLSVGAGRHHRAIAAARVHGRSRPIADLSAP